MDKLRDEVSIIGARVIFDHHSSVWRRLTWTVLVMFGIAVMLYQVNDRITTYLSYPTAVEYKVKDKDMLPFPALTICNINSVRRNWFGPKKSKQTIQNIKEYQAYNREVQSRLREAKIEAKTTDSSLIDFSLDKNMSGKTRYLSDKQLSEAAHPISVNREGGIIQSVFWKGNALPLNEFKKWITDIGYCYELNDESIDVKSSEQSGIQTGLYMLINVARDQYIGSEVNDRSAGFKASVTTQGDWADAENGILLGPGLAHEVQLSMFKHTRLPSPYGTCTEVSSVNEVWPELNISYNMSYSHKACIAACKAKSIHERCGCVPSTMSMFYGMAPASLGNPESGGSECTHMWQDVCFRYYNWHFYQKDNKEYKDWCMSKCVEPCQTYTYQVSHSSAPLYSDKAQKIGNINLEDAEDDWLTLKIYFSSMSLAEMTESEAYPFWALASDIGGALGLLLGSAIFTLVELLDIIICIIMQKSPLKRI